MKRLILNLIAIIAPICVIAQDNIYTTDQKVIECKVLLVDTATIQYKKWDNQTGPTYTISKHKVLVIRHQNGSSDFFNNSAPANTTPPTQPQVQQNNPPPSQIIIEQHDNPSPPQNTNSNYYQPHSQSTTPASSTASQREFGDQWSIYLGTDFSSAFDVGVTFEFRYGNGNGGDSYFGAYSSAEASFSINGGQTDWANTSALIYDMAGVTFGGLDPKNNFSAKLGLGIDYMSLSFMMEGQLNYTYHHFLAGVKSYYYGGFFYPELFLGVRF